MADIQTKPDSSYRALWATATLLALCLVIVLTKLPPTCAFPENPPTEAPIRAEIAERPPSRGPERPDTLASRENPILNLLKKSKLWKVKKEHRAVIAIQERTLGPERSDILTSRNDLASNLWAQRTSQEAMEEFESR